MLHIIPHQLRCDRLFIDEDYVRANEILTQTLVEPIPVFNVDGTLNKAGRICEVVKVILHINNHTEWAVFAVTKLGGYMTILGYTWLHKHNPQIDWHSKEISMLWCPQQCLTCQTDAKEEGKTFCAIETCVNACRSGPFPTLVEEYDEDEDDDHHEDTAAFEEGVPGARSPLQFDLNPYRLHPHNDHNSDVKIEEGDHIFAAKIHTEINVKYVRTPSTIST
jgi:hypothetical protein